MAKALRGAAPPPRLTVTENAERVVVLPASTPLPGPYSTKSAPFQREMQDVVGEPDVREVIYVCCTQIAKTTLLGNAIAFYSDVQPSPILFVGPTLGFSESYSKEKLTPLIESSPRLRALYGKRKSRDPDQTTMLKRFPGGYLALAGANAPAGMSGRSIRVAICDELDRFTGDAGEEGDPTELIDERLTAFWDSKYIKASTPTLKGLSKIEHDFLRSDQRYLFVPCPRCEWMQRLVWRDEANRFRLIWERDGKGHAIPGSERYVCVQCGGEIEESSKPAMLRGGEWRPTAVGEPGVVGFHLNQLYNPWSHWSRMRAKWERAQGNPRKLQVFINTQLAETFEEDASAPPELAGKGEQYNAEVPVGVGLLVAAVDTQDSWLEAKVVGYGEGEESWLIAHQQFLGDPGQNKVWLELDEWLKQRFLHECGLPVGITAVAIDSGGHHSDSVYKFCKARQARKIFPIRGGSDGRDFLGMPSRNNSYRVPLYTLNVSAGKDVVFSRMRTTKPGPEFMHLPNWVDEEYIEQLTKSEKKIARYVKGKGATRVYVKMRDRNEALDLEVYCLAALYSLGPQVRKRLGEKAAELVRLGQATAAAGRAPKGTPPGERLADVVRQERKVSPRSHRGRGRGWVGSWKD